MSKRTVEQRKKVLAEHYAKRFGCRELLEPVHYVEKNWSADEYVGGGYVFNYPPGVLMSFGSELRKPVGGVHFAGSETATYWAGCLEGAVQSGERAARELLHRMSEIPASQIWHDELDSQQIIDETIRPTIFSSNSLSTTGTVLLVVVLAVCLRGYLRSS